MLGDGGLQYWVAKHHLSLVHECKQFWVGLVRLYTLKKRKGL